MAGLGELSTVQVTLTLVHGCADSAATLAVLGALLVAAALGNTLAGDTGLVGKTVPQVGTLGRADAEGTECSRRTVGVTNTLNDLGAANGWIASEPLVAGAQRSVVDGLALAIDATNALQSTDILERARHIERAQLCSNVPFIKKKSRAFINRAYYGIYIPDNCC